MKRALVVAVAILFAACGDVTGDYSKLRDAEARLRKNPHDGEALGFVLHKLDDIESITRNNAAAVLRLAAGDANVRAAIAPRAVPALIEVARRHNDNEQEGIAALGEFRELGAPAVPTLTKLLSDPAPPIEQYATVALGKIGPASTPAVPVLRKQLQRKGDPAWDRSIHMQTAVAIRRIVPDDHESLDALIESLRSSDPNVRLDAIMALQDLGKLAVAAIPALESYGGDENARRAVRSIQRDAGMR